MFKTGCRVRGVFVRNQQKKTKTSGMHTVASIIPSTVLLLQLMQLLLRLPYHYGITIPAAATATLTTAITTVLPVIAVTSTSTSTTTSSTTTISALHNS